MSFTPEELVFLCCFAHGSRAEAMMDIAVGAWTTDDRELLDLCRAMLEKLARMTDAEFDAADFSGYEEFANG